jgi:cyclase
VLVIDTRLNPAMAHELSAAIRSVTDKPVTHVVNTHFHGDHTFGNQVFAAGGAEIIGSTLTQDKLRTEGETTSCGLAAISRRTTQRWRSPCRTRRSTGRQRRTLLREQLS